MKVYLIHTVLLLGLLLSGCGSDDSSEETNDNSYNLRAINLSTSLSFLLEGSYSNGLEGSIFVSRTDAGNDYVNGVSVSKVKTDTSITLNNGYTSQESSISLIDSNGFTLAFDDTLAYCTLTTNSQIIPTSAKVGDTSEGTSIYSCDDSTNRTVSWKLTNANNGNAYYIFDTVISGASQSKNTTTLTITPDNKIIYYKVFVDIIAQDVQATFEGSVN